MGRIVFLGTGGDSFVVGKQIRASGGIIIQEGEIQLHIDPGPGAIIRAIETTINPRANTAILVSNNHLINSNDLNAVIDAMTYGGLDKKGVLVTNKTVANGTEETNPVLTKKHRELIEKMILLNPEQKLGIENIEIHATKAINEDPNAIGFKIFTNESIIGYSGDTKYTKEIARQFKETDILILNVSAPTNEKEENRLNSDDAVKFINEAKPRLAVIRNFGIKMLKADPLNEGREIQRKTGVQVVTAKDGISLAPGNYEAKSKQKRLSLYKDQSTGEVKTEEIEETIKETESKEQNNQ